MGIRYIKINLADIATAEIYEMYKTKYLKAISQTTKSQDSHNKKVTNSSGKMSCSYPEKGIKVGMIREMAFFSFFYISMPRIGNLDPIVIGARYTRAPI